MDHYCRCLRSESVCSLWIGGGRPPLSLLLFQMNGIRLKRWFAILIPLFWLVFSVAKRAESIVIAVAGSWSETINASDLIAGAGSDLIDSYESATDALSISISETTGASDAWRIDVKKVDANWHSDFILHVKRTSDGTGGSVSGGTSYQQVTDTSSSFFSGSDNVSGINSQLKSSGVSIRVPPDNYTTTIYYTVVDI